MTHKGNLFSLSGPLVGKPTLRFSIRCVLCNKNVNGWTLRFQRGSEEGELWVTHHGAEETMPWRVDAIDGDQLPHGFRRMKDGLILGEAFKSTEISNDQNSSE